ncbi:unconventional myosin-XVI-like, partial [Saccoglossus kowalevskii]
MEIDQSILEILPKGQRMKIAKKLRQEQIKRYNQVERPEKNVPVRIRRHNKKKTQVNFNEFDKLRDAVSRFDDIEVLTLMDRGVDPNTVTVTGTSVLHQCCMEDNLSAAETLIEKGADVNRQDDDWWTPLHVASACDNPDLSSLLLSNGADPSILDIDGNFAVEHAPPNSETKLVIEKHMLEQGIDRIRMKQIRQRQAKQMLSDIKDLIAIRGDINAANHRGATL